MSKLLEELNGRYRQIKTAEWSALREEVFDLEIRIKELEAELKEAHIVCAERQQEINCLRMEPCQLPKCVTERDNLKAKIDLSVKGFERIMTLFSESGMRAKAKEMLEKLGKNGK